MKNIKFYWPDKPVSTDVQLVRLDNGKPNPYPQVRHKGYGLILQKDGHFIVYCASGIFVWIDGGGQSVTCNGLGKGVICYFNLWSFIKRLFE